MFLNYHTTRITQEQLQHIFAILNNKIEDKKDEAKENAATSLSTLTGMHRYTDCNKCMLCNNETKPWIIDNGATNHMTHKKEFFVELTTLKNPFNMTLPNGKIVEVNYSGTIIFTSNLVLRNVFFVPTFHFNLIYVTQLIKTYQGSIIFTSLHCLLQAPSMKRPLFLVKHITDTITFKLLQSMIILSKNYLRIQQMSFILRIVYSFHFSCCFESHKNV